MNFITHTVRPNIPENLKPLEEIANNLWLSWNYDAISLFIRLDYDAWLHSEQNPAKLLGMVSQERLEEMAGDDSYLAAVGRVYEQFQNYLNRETWYQGDHKEVIAYFSMEYGLDVSLPIYSGGLGILSGDHMKTSSDLGLPLVGVGLLYRQGYFQQYLNADGYQQESYPENDWYTMPVRLLRAESEEPYKISVEMADQTVIAQLWEARVGRSSLYLLDTNIDENTPENREITATLYGGNKETRIKQEILLGIGGIRALEALDMRPAATHMNEGHSAFLAIERIRVLMREQKMSFSEASQAVWPTNIFTTHTPVPAGNERFDIDLTKHYFGRVAQELGISWEDFLALGRENPADPHEPFCMTVLALKLSAYNNAVSLLHGHVSRDMWKQIWHGLPISEIPISAITNGVHPRTWISHSMLDLIDRYFGPRFQEEPTKFDVWDRMSRISDEELWRTHERRRERMVAFVRDRLKTQLTSRGATDSQVSHAEDVLSPYTLTISFARRFATYKRATLLFRDPDRLIKLLSDPERPIQLIFAGKAHPHDKPGKELIRDIIHFAAQPEVRSRIVFLENYDMTMSRYLISGSDLWMNTPRRPLEASGTSGMKAAINGVLNVSVLDGWWDEAYTPEIGWAIGSGEEYEDHELHDEIESKALYNLLEQEIIPAFYNRGRDNLPREWISRMKSSISNVGKQFSSTRMLMEYSQRFYFPALENARRLHEVDYKSARELSSYFETVRSQWNEFEVVSVSSSKDALITIGDKLDVGAQIRLPGVKPDQVSVELYYGRLITSAGSQIQEPERVEMELKSSSGDLHEFTVTITCRITGKIGYSVRILPKHPALVHPFVPGLIKW
ncbi:MAG: alpha-glucan family phosphorylase [Spirochaetales bacterium]|nr:alpha-glucan family phosphorylase [Spirochaetales bacterium]MCF7939875.1 alpha-glucan family phosphorylase [Spirochaetales bacterium]